NHRTKFDSRARKAVYLGHKQGVKGAVLLDLNTKSIFVSRHVTYHEHILPYQNHNPPFQWSYHSIHPTPNTDTPPTPIIDDDFLVTTQCHPSHSNIDVPPSVPTSSTPPLSPSPSPSPSSSPSSSDDNVIVLRKSTRLRSKPAHLTDYVCNLSVDSSKLSSQ
ncbi:retrovirus-related pol polyprotein from transposon TNT 1-94, partial [Trifolium medium]|nr:retrovirus-related pol polyprotein from transposon TNT 1-94 [Trifolium medium]